MPSEPNESTSRRAGRIEAGGVPGDGCRLGRERIAEHRAEQLAAGVVEALGGGQVGLGVGDRVQPGEGQAGLEVGVVERLERLVGRGDALARIAAPDLAARVAVLDREQAGQVVVEERREAPLGEVVDQGDCNTETVSSSRRFVPM